MPLAEFEKEIIFESFRRVRNPSDGLYDKEGGMASSHLWDWKMISGPETIGRGFDPSTRKFLGYLVSWGGTLVLLPQEYEIRQPAKTPETPGEIWRERVSISREVCFGGGDEILLQT